MAWTAAFLQRMHELGWSEGRNLAIEYRWAEGHTERLAGLADELVRLLLGAQPAIWFRPTGRRRPKTIRTYLKIAEPRSRLSWSCPIRGKSQER